MAVKAKGRGVFFDRDGVLNRAIVRAGKPYPPSSLAEMELEAEAAETASALRKLGLTLLVVTNQPDVARGTQQKERVEEINAYLRQTLRLDAVYTCYHDSGDGCQCRKPLPGMLQQGATEWQLDLPRSFLIGDRFKDIEAGLNAGCTTILLDRQYAEPETAQPHYRISSLSQMVSIIRDQIQKEEK
jgi:D-glycero-D-manno-heptose 1,7-bisphosphate phosphatase